MNSFIGYEIWLSDSYRIHCFASYWRFKQYHMSKLFTIVAFFISSFTFAQTDSRTYINKAFKYYFDEKYDSALYYYLKIEPNTSLNKTAFYSDIATCYYKTGHTQIAKAYLQKGIADSFNLDRRSLSQRGCCLGLVDILMEEGKFYDALTYLRLAQRKFPHFRMCSLGDFERKINLNYKYAKCFEGIQQVDSAINYLTPYVFGKAEDIMYDSLEYLSIINYYYTLLRTKYSGCEISSLLHSAIQNLFYKREVDAEMKIRYPENTFYNVKCYLVFMGCRVVLFDSEYDLSSWGAKSAELFSKESFENLINEFELVKLINHN